MNKEPNQKSTELYAGPLDVNTQENASDPENKTDQDTNPVQKNDGSGHRGSQNHGASVFIYLAILFAAAFFMLLLAYLMQQRNNEAALSGLRDSISQFQSIDELMDVNEALQKENEVLKAQLEQVQDELESMTTERDAALAQSQEYEKTIDVLTILYEAELKVSEEDYSSAAALLADCDDETLSSVVVSYDSDSSTLSLQNRYDALVSILVDKGYLTQLDDGTLSVNAAD